MNQVPKLPDQMPALAPLQAASLKHERFNPLTRPDESPRFYGESAVLRDTLGPDRFDEMAAVAEPLGGMTPEGVTLPVAAERAAYLIRHARSSIGEVRRGRQPQPVMSIDEMGVQAYSARAWMGVTSVAQSYVSLRERARAEGDATPPLNLMESQLLTRADTPALATYIADALEPSLMGRIETDSVAVIEAKSPTGFDAWETGLGIAIRAAMTDISSLRAVAVLSGDQQTLLMTYKKFSALQNTLAGTRDDRRIVSLTRAALSKDSSPPLEVMHDALDEAGKQRLIRAVIIGLLENAKISIAKLKNNNTGSVTLRAHASDLVRGAFEFCQQPDISAALHASIRKMVPEQYENQLPAIDTSKVEEMDWEVLPVGKRSRVEALQTAADEILEEANARRKPGSRKLEIAPERLDMLNRMAEAWGGPEDSYLTKGKLSGRRTIRVDGKESPDEYIVLVLRHRAPDGSVLFESAWGENPIAGPHALYAFREDVNPSCTWRDAMSATKDEAVRVGARPVFHTEVAGEELAVTMLRKAMELARAKPEDFHLLEFNGRRKACVRATGQTAVRGALIAQASEQVRAAAETSK